MKLAVRVTALILSLSAVMAADVTFQWSEPQGATGYWVYYSPSAGEYQPDDRVDASDAICNSGSCAVVCTVPDSQVNVLFFKLVPFNSYGAGESSNETQAVVSVPSTVSDFEAVDSTPSTP